MSSIEWLKLLIELLGTCVLGTAIYYLRFEISNKILSRLAEAEYGVKSFQVNILKDAVLYILKKQHKIKKTDLYRCIFLMCRGEKNQETVSGTFFSYAFNKEVPSSIIKKVDKIIEEGEGEAAKIQEEGEWVILKGEI